MPSLRESLFDRSIVTLESLRRRARNQEQEYSLAYILEIREQYVAEVENVVRCRAQLNESLVTFDNVYARVLKNLFFGFIAKEKIESKTNQAGLENVTSFLDFQGKRMILFLESLSFCLTRKSFLSVRGLFQQLLKDLVILFEKGGHDWESLVEAYWELIFSFRMRIVSSVWPKDERFQAYVLGDQVSRGAYLAVEKNELVGENTMTPLKNKLMSSVQSVVSRAFEKNLNKFDNSSADYSEEILALSLWFQSELLGFEDLEQLIQEAQDFPDSKEITERLINYVLEVVEFVTKIRLDLWGAPVEQDVKYQLISGFYFLGLKNEVFLTELGLLDFLNSKRDRIIKELYKHPELLELFDLDDFLSSDLVGEVLGLEDLQEILGSRFEQKAVFSALMLESVLGACGTLSEEEREALIFVFSFLWQTKQIGLVEDLLNVINGCSFLRLETEDRIVALLRDFYSDNSFNFQIDIFSAYLKKRTDFWNSKDKS